MSKEQFIAQMQAKGLGSATDIVDNFEDNLKLSPDKLVEVIQDWARETYQLKSLVNSHVINEIVVDILCMYVHRLHSNNGHQKEIIKDATGSSTVSTIVSNKEEIKNEALPAKMLKADGVRVRVGLGFTKNIGNFESVRSEAYAEHVCDAGEESQTMEQLTDLCSSHLDKVANKFCQPQPAEEGVPLDKLQATSDEIQVEQPATSSVEAEVEEPIYSDKVNEVIDKAKETFSVNEVEVVEDPKVLIDLKADLFRKIKLAAKSKEICYDLAINKLKANSKALTIAKVTQLINDINSGNYEYFKGVSDDEAESHLEDK